MYGIPRFLHVKRCQVHGCLRARFRKNEETAFVSGHSGIGCLLDHLFGPRSAILRIPAERPTIPLKE